MIDWLFATLLALSLLFIAVGMMFANMGPPSKHESCGFSGLLIVVGCILGLVSLVWVVVAMAMYASGT